MQPQGETFSAIKMEAWMYLENPDITLETGVEELKQAGNVILEIDSENKRIKVADEEIKL